jgi:hypothetical protein
MNETTNETKHFETRQNTHGRRGHSSRTRVSAIERRERDHRCVNMRRADAEWKVIADALGYSSPGHAHDSFMTFMHEYPREDAEIARDVEADRLDQLQRALWPHAIDRYSPKQRWASERVLQLMDQRARLLGLNKPVAQRHEVTVLTEDAVDNAIRALETEIEARAAEAGIVLGAE